MGRKKAFFLSFTKKIRKFRRELRGLNNCARTTRKLPNAKSLQQIFTLTRKYTLHSILRSLFESLVRVSLPSSPRAQADCLFFRKKWEAADSGQVDLNSFDDTNESLSLSLSLSDSHSTTEEFNLTRHPRLQILSLSRAEEFFVCCLRSRFTSKAVCLYEAFFF